MVTYSTPEYIDGVAWLIRFTSDRTPPVSFRVFRDGTQIAAFTSTDGKGHVYVSVPPGDGIYLEAIDRDGQIPAIAFPGRLTLNWIASGNDHYDVEQLVDAVWTKIGTVPDDGRYAFTFVTPWLADDTTHQFRVVPVDAANQSGTPLSFSVLMVRHPDVPNVTYTLNGNRTVTLAAA